MLIFLLTISRRATYFCLCMYVLVIFYLIILDSRLVNYRKETVLSAFCLLCFDCGAVALSVSFFYFGVLERKMLGYCINFWFITKIYLYNFDPLKPHFYIVKLGFTGVYIIFLILLKNIHCWYSLEPPRLCFEQKNEKILECLSESFQFFGVKCSQYIWIGVFS